MGRFQCGVPYTWQLPWLAVEWPWLALAEPFLHLVSTNERRNHSSSLNCRDTVSGAIGSFSVGKSVRWLESPEH